MECFFCYSYDDLFKQLENETRGRWTCTFFCCSIVAALSVVISLFDIFFLVHCLRTALQSHHHHHHQACIVSRAHAGAVAGWLDRFTFQHNACVVLILPARFFGFNGLCMSPAAMAGAGYRWELGKKQSGSTSWSYGLESFFPPSTLLFHMCNIELYWLMCSVWSTPDFSAHRFLASDFLIKSALIEKIILASFGRRNFGAISLWLWLSVS